MTLVLLTGIAAIAVAARRRVLFRMAVRNAGRRKVQVALAIGGGLVPAPLPPPGFPPGRGRAGGRARARGEPPLHQREPRGGASSARGVPPHPLPRVRPR